NASPTADIIEFDSALTGGTIMLGGTQLEITDSVTINGLGRDLLTIDAGGLSRIFEISPVGADQHVSIDGLTLTGGFTTGTGNDRFGGAILQLAGNLTLTNSRLIENQAEVRGAGMYAFSGEVVIDNVEFTDNTTISGGGDGAFAFGGDNATISNSTFAGSSGYAVLNFGSLSIDNTDVVGNDGGVESFGELTITDSLISQNNDSGVRVSGSGTIIRTT